MFAGIHISDYFQFAQGAEMRLVGQWLFSWWPYVAVVVGSLLVYWFSFRYIAHNSVGVVEKLWSWKGSVPEGQIIALDGEAGFEAELLRGGLHFGYWRWQYQGPANALGDDLAGQDRLCLRPRRRAARVEPDAWPGGRLQLFPRRPRVPCRRDAGRWQRRSWTARSPAGDPPRRRLRDQPRPVRGDCGRPRLHAAGNPLAAGAR